MNSRFFLTLHQPRPVKKIITELSMSSTGVFQAAEEFIEVWTPDRLILATKREGLAGIYQIAVSKVDSRSLGTNYVTWKEFHPAPNLFWSAPDQANE